MVGIFVISAWKDSR